MIECLMSEGTSVIDKDFELATETMRTVWAICKNLQARKLSMFDAIRDCNEAIDSYEITMLLNREGENDGEEITNTGGK